MTFVLGISAFYHDSAAALIQDGKIIAAAQEERFTRKKHDSDYPKNAVNFAEKICHFNNIEKQRYSIVEKDFTTYTKQNKFERIICGEFLEHVEDPVKIMKQLSNLLTTDGKIFLTAAIWSGGVDHIYLYENPKQVRQHISEAGLMIEKELVQPVFDKDKEYPEKGKIPINYAAILSKSN